MKKGCTSAQRVFEKGCTSALRVTFFCRGDLPLLNRPAGTSALLRCELPILKVFDQQYSTAMRVASFEEVAYASALRVFEKECTSILRVTNCVAGVCFCSASPREGAHFCLTSYAFLRKGCTSAQRVFEKRCTSALLVIFFAEGLSFCNAGLREAVHSCAASRSF